MKSHASSLLVVACGILKDVRMAYPEYRWVERDISRLTHLVETRGLGVFTLDLPSRLDSLIEGLKTGRLVTNGTRRYSKSYPVPRLFAGLYMRIFDKNLCIKSDPDVNAVAFLLQLLKIGKKTEVACSPTRFQDALETYHEIERELARPTLRWADDILDPDSVGRSLHFHNLMVSDLPLFPGLDRAEERDAGLLDKCQRVADLLVEALGHFEAFSYSERRSDESTGFGFRHGPGAVAERVGSFDKNDFPNWSAKLQEWFPFTEFGKMPNSPKTQPRNHEVASRLIAVPKTAKGPRLIAAEPTEHQWCQQLMLRWFDERFRAIFNGSFITLNDQQPSGEMARLGSLDGALATVDLSSASDRLTCWVVERVFRRSPLLLHSLHACRTRYVYDGLSKIPSYTKLKKFASQGTAVTFPVQSFVFLIIALSVSLDDDVSWTSISRLRNKVRVFGDDIVIPKHGYADIVRLLHILGLKVNEGKSFATGNFRESCGVDAFMGYNVTPIAPKSTMANNPTARKALLDTTNNLFNRGYWWAARALESTQDATFLKRVTIMGRAAGAKARSSFSLNRRVFDDFIKQLDSERNNASPSWRAKFFDGRQVRYNHHLQRYEVSTFSTRDKVKKRDRDCGYSSLLQFSVAERSLVGREITPRYSGVLDRPRTSDSTRWEPLNDLFV